MQPNATDGVAWSVYVSVCLSVGHSDVLCKNSWTDQDAVLGLTRMGPRSHALAGGQGHPQEGAICVDWLALWKAFRVFAVVYAAKGLFCH